MRENIYGKEAKVERTLVYLGFTSKNLPFPTHLRLKTHLLSRRRREGLGDRKNIFGREKQNWWLFKSDFLAPRWRFVSLWETKWGFLPQPDTVFVPGFFAPTVAFKILLSPAGCLEGLSIFRCWLTTSSRSFWEIKQFKSTQQPCNFGQKVTFLLTRYSLKIKPYPKWPD